MTRWLRVLIAVTLVLGVGFLGVIAYEEHQQTNEAKRQTCFAQAQAWETLVGGLYSGAYSQGFSSQIDAPSAKVQLSEVGQIVDVIEKQCHPLKTPGITAPTTTTTIFP